MSHDRLWAPWRLGYIQGKDPPESPAERPIPWPAGADPLCFLCRGVADTDDRGNLVVARKSMNDFGGGVIDRRKAFAELNQRVRFHSSQQMTQNLVEYLDLLFVEPVILDQE